MSDPTTICVKKGIYKCDMLQLYFKNLWSLVVKFVEEVVQCKWFLNILLTYNEIREKFEASI